METLDASARERIDEALQAWRQGDYTRGEHWFVFRIAADAPLTESAVAAAREGSDTAESKVFGLAVVTQTCDIVRRCADREFLELCPLVEVDEGRALRALREIWVRAAPSWDADRVELAFWFVRNEDEPTFEARGWYHYLEVWLKRVESKGRFVRVEGVVQTLADMTAQDYVESDPLDLDHLSTREP